MEAKVDVRKLQILNDRINQTIDALSQVRLSVHGLGHTGVPTPMMNPFMTQGFGYPSIPPFPGIPPVPPISPFGMVPPIPFPGPLGFSHTPYTPPVNPLSNPFLTQGFGYPSVPPFPGPLGFSHTPFTPPVNPFFNVPTPFTPPFVNPMLSSVPTPGITPNWPTPWTEFGRGLFHTPIDPLELKLLEMRALDPIRIRETFPFVSY